MLVVGEARRRFDLGIWVSGGSPVLSFLHIDRMHTQYHPHLWVYSLLNGGAKLSRHCCNKHIMKQVGMFSCRRSP